MRADLKANIKKGLKKRLSAGVLKASGSLSGAGGDPFDAVFIKATWRGFGSDGLRR